MHSDEPSARARLEEFLPLRHRWLRYFLAGGGLILLALWWCIGGHDDWHSFSTLFSADPQFIHSRSTFSWGLSCGGGASLGGHTAMKLQIGPWELTWLAREFWQSGLERTIRIGLNLVSLLASVGFLVHAKIQAIQRGETGKCVRIGGSRRMVL